MLEKEIANSRDLVFMIMTEEPEVLKEASEEIRNDKKFLRLAAIYFGTDIMQYAGEEVKKDEDFMAEIKELKDNERKPGNKEMQMVRKR